MWRVGSGSDGHTSGGDVVTAPQLRPRPGALGCMTHDPDLHPPARGSVWGPHAERGLSSRRDSTSNPGPCPRDLGR